MAQSANPFGQVLVALVTPFTADGEVDWAGVEKHIDDVITAGTAVRESLGLIRAAGAEVAGVLVALDRQERGQGALSATQELAREQGVPTFAIVGLTDLLEFAGSRADLAGERPRLEAYRARFGAG